MGRRALILINGKKPDAVLAADHVAELIGGYGEVLGQFDVRCEGIPGEASQADLLVVLGGDGTLLTAARRFGGLGKPFVGINAGRVGFMAEFDLDAVSDHASILFGSGDLFITHLPTLNATTLGPESQHRNSTQAVNEFVITAGPPYRMITVRIRIDGILGPNISGDGLIVSTPTGSTAYNVSAGGPIVVPGLDAMVLTPIAAHSLSFRPIVLPMDRTIELEIEAANDGGEEPGTALVGDGQLVSHLGAGDRVRITGGPHRIPFVVNPDVTYWNTLMSKMRWAARPKIRNGF